MYTVNNLDEIFSRQGPDIVLQEWETIGVEDYGSLGAEYARMVDEEPKAGPFACFNAAFNFFK